MSNADVELIAPFEGRIMPGKVGTAELADAAVTKPKLAGGIIKRALVAGGAAGNITVTGIAVGDELIAVLHLVGAATTMTNLTDLTAEFTVSAANTINNTGGTSSAGGKLLILYQDRA